MESAFKGASYGEGAISTLTVRHESFSTHRQPNPFDRPGSSSVQQRWQQQRLRGVAIRYLRFSSRFQALTRWQEGKPSDLERVRLRRSGSAISGTQDLRRKTLNACCGPMRENRANELTQIGRVEAEWDDGGGCNCPALASVRMLSLHLTLTDIARDLRPADIGVNDFSNSVSDGSSECTSRDSES